MLTALLDTMEVDMLTTEDVTLTAPKLVPTEEDALLPIIATALALDILEMIALEMSMSALMEPHATLLLLAPTP